MKQKVCLKNSSGKVVRILPLPDIDKMVVTRNPEDQRLLFRPSYEKEVLLAQGWDILKEVSCADVLNGSVKLTSDLTLAKYTEDLVSDPVASDDDNSLFRKSALLSLLLGLMLLSIMLNVPKPSEQEVKEEIKQQVVKIIKQQKAEVIKLNKIARSQPTPQNNTPQPKVKSTNQIKRMGALAALGSLSNSKQQGGLDLGAVAKSAGPGMGGTQGSGGVQTSLYGKGIVSAPLGVGGNLKGAGGYGTKGAGGGKAGYGKLSLVGSAGTSVIPLGTEVISGGGLSNENIFAVIRRNQGQIRFCYEQGLQSDPKLKGTVKTNFTINSNGQVASVSIAGTTLNSKIVEDCISLRIKSWKFPLPQGGQAVTINVPFTLNKQGQGQG
jgi:hypothetical protein